MKRHMYTVLLYVICIITLLAFIGCGKQTSPKQSPIPQEDIPPGSGNVTLMPASTTTQVNAEFTTDLFINSGKQKVAAYGLIINFSSDVIKVDETKGTSGVEPGKDGYVAAQNANIPGQLSVAGFDVYGKGPGNALHFLTIHWKAIKKGKTTISINVKNLVDETTRDVGRPNGIAAEVVIE